MSIIIGIDHGYYAIKTAHCSFPAGLTSYGEHEPYTRQGLLEFGGCFFVCGSGRQPIQRDKTINDNYYLLTLAAIAKEIRQRGLPPEGGAGGTAGSQHNQRCSKPTASECYTRLCARFPEFTVGGDSNVLIIGRKAEGKKEVYTL